jgi:glycosyltransferase involved in cell wall biosynthesis
VRLTKRDLKFDAIHWHASRVYPLFFLIPATKTLITLHDATNRIYKKVNTVWTKIFYWNLRLFHNKIDFIIGDSIDACRNLTSIGKFAPSKVKCVYLGSNFDTVNAISPNNFKENNFFLCVSRWQPHKNVTTLLKGFNSAYLEDSSIPNLVLVGKPVNGFDEPSRLISQLQLQHKVCVLEDLSDAELAFLYDHALIHVSPSLYEGFGLPVLEGLKRGCPSIDHSGTSTSEVSGIAGIHIDMNNEFEISKALLLIASDSELVIRLRALAKSRSNIFTWEKTVNSLKKIYFDDTDS